MIGNVEIFHNPNPPFFYPYEYAPLFASCGLRPFPWLSVFRLCPDYVASRWNRPELVHCQQLDCRLARWRHSHLWHSRLDRQRDDSRQYRGHQLHGRERPDFARDFTNFTMSAQAVRRDGSAAIDLAYVACGRFDGFWEDGLNPWDIAAGILLIQEAGGRVTDFRDAPLDIYTPKVLASNGLIHKAMMGVLTNS